ncbi:metalloregulator ArsR/SmtB family transcription factor [soil metagenome]|jgi:ArsR family transcriptional regulator|nr:helix-turn-helix transcriptional regulator [Acidimicrobiia bacterium]
MGNQESTIRDRCCPELFAGVLDEAQAEELAVFVKALADPVRLRLVSIMGAAPTGEVCACDLPALVGRSQSTISHHLSQLTSAGIVEREQRGKWAWFRLRGDRFGAFVTALAPRPTTTG